MRVLNSRTVSLILAAAASSAALSVITPFLYADITETRQLPASAAAGAFALFAVGTALAAPLVGSLTDRFSATTVAVSGRLLAAVAFLALGYAATTPNLLLAAALLGATASLARVPIQVLLVRSAPPGRARDVFGLAFVAMNGGSALGAVAGGALAKLSDPAQMHRLYWIAAAVSALGNVFVLVAPRSTRVAPQDGTQQQTSYRALLGDRRIRLLLAIAFVITLACWGQYTSGLPAYALTTLHVSPRSLGVSIAVSELLVASLTSIVVARTRHVAGPQLLAVAGLVWAACWVLFALPLFTGLDPGAAVFAGLAVLALGDTLMAPVLSPLAVTLAGEASSGRAMAAVSALSTSATALGPILASVLLGLELPRAFVLAQAGICLLAVVMALRLRATLRAGAAAAVLSPG
jgi:Major Facilitator Superfamily